MSKRNGSKSFLAEEEAHVRAKAARGLVIVLIVTVLMGTVGLAIAIYGLIIVDGFGGAMIGAPGLMMMLAFVYPYSVLKNGWSQVLEKRKPTASPTPSRRSSTAPASSRASNPWIPRPTDSGPC